MVAHKFYIDHKAKMPKYHSRLLYMYCGYCSELNPNTILLIEIKWTLTEIL